MRFDIYGRFQLEIRRANDSWEVYRHDLGKRAKVVDLVVPSTLAAEEIATWLDDIYHEFSGRPTGRAASLTPGFRNFARTLF